MTDAFFETYRQKLIGLPVSHVWRGFSTALFFEFGDLTQQTIRDGSPGQPQGQYSIMIEWAWRIENETSILCGNDNGEDEWSVSFARLIGRKVEDIALVGRLPELAVSLSGGFHVASFSTLDGELGWAIFDRVADPRWIRFKEGRIVEESETETPASNIEGVSL